MAMLGREVLTPVTLIICSTTTKRANQTYGAIRNIFCNAIREVDPTPIWSVAANTVFRFGGGGGALINFVGGGGERGVSLVTLVIKQNDEHSV